MTDGRSTLELAPLQATNVLGYLAALGVLRVLEEDADLDVRMSWRGAAGDWKPLLHLPDGMSTEEDVLDAIESVFQTRDAEDYLFEVPDNIAPDAELESLDDEELELDTVRLPWNRAQYRYAKKDAQGDAPAWRMELLEALADEVAEIGEDAKSEKSPFHVLTSGKQRIAKIFSTLHTQTERDHLRRSLFDSWRLRDRGDSHRRLRLDPTIYFREEAQNDSKWSERGANRMAVEGFRFFPVFIEASQTRPLSAPGFAPTSNDGFGQLTYLVWHNPLGCTEVEALFDRPELYRETPDTERLNRMGVTLLRTYRRTGRGDSSKRFGLANEIS